MKGTKTFDMSAMQSQAELCVKKVLSDNSETVTGSFIRCSKIATSPVSSTKNSSEGSSQGEEDDSLLDLEPLDPIDIVHNNGPQDDDEVQSRIPKDSQIFSVAMDIPRKRKTDDDRRLASCFFSSIESNRSVILRWQHAAKKALRMEDPFGKFHLEKYEAERVLRYRYNPFKSEWVKDEILVKMATEPFGRGAMRECFRLKRVRPSHVNHNVSRNYVAKRYIDSVDRSVYMEDVRLQMYSKLWGEEFNRNNPPKKVDFCQMSIIEFLDRVDKPFYHLEHFIEGKYIKYNSNSGFIQCENMRFTPQAFSHFTFEKSGHEQIVVDIQGVGDLYTDPQIHTCDGTDFNEGNLGVKGMALFFHSHVCNPICESLGLTPFDLDKTEASVPDVCRILQSAKTCVRSTVPLSSEVVACSVGSSSNPSSLSDVKGRGGSAGARQRTLSSPTDMHAARVRTLSLVTRRRHDSHSHQHNHHRHMGAESTALPKTPSPSIELHHDRCSSPLVCSPIGNLREHSLSSESEDQLDVDVDSVIESIGFSEDDDLLCRGSNSHLTRSERTRSYSECSFVGDPENDKQEFQRQVEQKALPSNVEHEISYRQALEDQGVQLSPSILGQIHLEIARYHESGRFNPEDAPDPLSYNHKAALHHVKMAALCGNLEALLTLAKMYQGAPHDLLEAVEVEKNDELAVKYLRLAASAGDASSMISLAKHLDAQLCWTEAVDWYQKAIASTEFDEGGDFDCRYSVTDPVYTLLARLASIYAEGGNGLERDKGKAYEVYQQAAEAAMAATKGRLANKYYQLAESL